MRGDFFTGVLQVAAFMLCAVWQPCFGADAGAPSKPGNSEEVVEALPKMAPHPRLFMERGAEQRILKGVKSNPEMSRLHDGVIKTAYDWLKKPLLKRNQVGKRILHTSKEACARMEYWGYAYRMTKDLAFAERAKKEIENLSKFEDWNPSHYLDVVEMSLAFAIARDWFDSAFDAQTKNLIARQIEEKAFATFFGRKHFWYESDNSNNWNQICNMGLLCGAIAVYDESPEMSEKVIKATLKSIRRGLSQCYSEGGTYVEGLGYWEGGTFFQTLYLNALQTAFGTDFGMLKRYPGYTRSAMFAVSMVGASGLVYNFSDDRERAAGRNPLLFWFAKTSGDSSILYSQRRFYEEGFKPGMQQDVFSLIWAPDADFKNVAPPRKLVWSDADAKNPVVLARTGWGKGALFLGAKGGKAALSHAHMDASSFVFDALGERWVFDFGSQDYNSLEKLKLNIWDFSQRSDRWKVFRYGNLSHAVVVVNGEPFDVSADVRFAKIYDSPKKKGVLMDNTALYCGALKKSSREIFIEDSKRLRVVDRLVNGKESSKISWRMPTWKNVEVAGKNSALVVSPSGKIMKVRAALPEGFKAVVLPAESGNSWDAKNRGRAILAFEGTLSPGQNACIDVALAAEEASRGN